MSLVQGSNTDFLICAVAEISGGEPVPLTNDDSAEADLVYAPDGESIYFSRTDRSGTSIWRLGAGTLKLDAATARA